MWPYLLYFYFHFTIAFYCGGSDICTLLLHRSNFKSRENCDCLIVGNGKINLK